jgi:hypothetical protein
LDGNVSSFLAAHIAKVIGLALFVGVFYQIMKEKRLAEERAKT